MVTSIHLRGNLLHTESLCWYIISSFASLEELQAGQCSCHRRRTFVSSPLALRSVNKSMR